MNLNVLGVVVLNVSMTVLVVCQRDPVRWAVDASPDCSRWTNDVHVIQDPQVSTAAVGGPSHRAWYGGVWVR